MINIIRINVLSVITKFNLIILVSIFSLIFLLTVSKYDNFSSIQQVLVLTFQGPKDIRSDITEFMKWLAYQVPILVILGNFFYAEINERSIYRIPRMGSKVRWLIGLIFSVFIISFLYYLFAFFIVFIYSYILDLVGLIVESKIYLFNESIAITEMFLIILMTSFLLAWIQWTVVLFSGNSNLAFSMSVFNLFFIIIIKNFHPIFYRFLPASQEVFKFHNSNSLILCSIIWIAFVGVIMLLLNIRFLKKNDLIKIIK